MSNAYQQPTVDVEAHGRYGIARGPGNMRIEFVWKPQSGEEETAYLVSDMMKRNGVSSAVVIAYDAVESYAPEPDTMRVVAHEGVDAGTLAIALSEHAPVKNLETLVNGVRVL